MRRYSSAPKRETARATRTRAVESVCRRRAPWAGTRGCVYAGWLASVGEWSGVSWAELLTALARKGLSPVVKQQMAVTHVEVIGFDDESRPSRPPRGFYASFPGASWIFSLEHG